jgi:excisionase family DNA binding protein
MSPREKLNDRVLVSIADAASTLGVCRDTINELRRAGKLEAVKIGSAVRITTESILAILDASPAPIAPRRRKAKQVEPDHE